MASISKAEALRSAYSHVYKFGESAAVGTDWETVWSHGGAYNWQDQSTPFNVQVSSSDAGDAAAGAGAAEVTIQGLDASGMPQTEVLAVTGTSANSGTADWTVIYRAWVSGLGSAAGEAATNIGNIHITLDGSALTGGEPDTATDVMAEIVADEGQTLMAVFQVPADRQGALVGLLLTYEGISTVGGDWRVRQQPYGGAARTMLRGRMDTGIHPIPFEVAQVIGSRARVWVEARLDSGTGPVGACFEMVVM